MRPPPFLPEETLIRVLRLAKFDGVSALVLGALFALVSAASGQLPFTAIGLLAAGAGAIELHGAELIRQGEPRGMNWLIASQGLMLLVIFSYCGMRLWLIAPAATPEHFQELFTASAAQWGMSLDDYLQVLNRLTALAVALVGIGFQGGMARYYWRRRQPIAQALAMETDEA